LTDGQSFYKVQKRREIALSCQSLLFEHGIRALTVAQIAQTAGVGKGTIYEYFDKKEDIVFEIMQIFIEAHQKQLNEIASGTLPCKEKLFRMLSLLFQDESSRKLLYIYREFLAISLMDGDEAMLRFSQESRESFSRLLQKILEAEGQGHIRAETLITFVSGLVVDSRLPQCDIPREIHALLDILILTDHQGE